MLVSGADGGQVVCTRETQAAVAAARQLGRPLWRVSSTVFVHIASDQVLTPLGHFASLQGAKETYFPVKAGKQVEQELAVIRLLKSSS